MERTEIDPARPLLGQKAIVTGASSGIGRGLALALGKAGAEVVVNHRGNEEAALAVTREIAEAGSPAWAIRADVSREDAVPRICTGWLIRRWPSRVEARSCASRSCALRRRAAPLRHTGCHPT